ncbi:DUF934 domain-containing protein [Noviherbaspirillum aerium]|uniref:DUF934 domain-containing protein n=1 Tax=Noviherbaspirillum aerium TaxID=2588497 RepID=UPI00124CF42E|nr:DUF934 domain-containing protein [Noviherbaspirillum aerium]
MPNIIKLVDGVPRIVDDEWSLIRTENDLDAASPKRIVSLPAFRDALGEGRHDAVRAVWIAPDDDFEPLMLQLKTLKALETLEIIAVDFPTFRDGRGYSIATLLRSRYAWKGELRAVGDVLRDQLNYLRRCGFDAFAVRADKDIHDAILSFGHYSVTYQGAVDEPLPLFRRRHD